MGTWRTQFVTALIVLGLFPVSAQDLGDAARAERERQSKVKHHAPVLSDEDLNREQILTDTPRDAEPASRPADNEAPISQDLPLGDYARRLRERRAAQEALAQKRATKPAAKPAVESESAVSRTAPPQAATDQKTAPLGDVARQARSQRDAARMARTRNHSSQPAAQASTEPSRAQGTQAARQVPETRTVPPASSSMKPPRTRELPSSAAERHVAQPAVLAPAANTPRDHQAKRPPIPAPAATPNREPEQAARPAVHKPAVPEQEMTAKRRSDHHPVAVPEPAARAATESDRRVMEPAVLAPAATTSRQPERRPVEPPVVEPAETADGDLQSIRVPRGASLWRLAREHLGAGHLWRELWKANPQIKDPNRIRAGQLLRIPVLNDREPADSWNRNGRNNQQSGRLSAEPAHLQLSLHRQQ